jgi:aminocarboxymuconate-semialdehyde decarboxylase
MANGVMDRFSRLKVLLSHGGGALPWIMPPLDKGYGLSAGMRQAIKEKPSEVARRFWYDTIVYSRSALRFMAQELGEDHLVVGSDYPFAIKQVRPGALAMDPFGPATRCLQANAEALLGIKFARPA